jgi:LysM repeat protein
MMVPWLEQELRPVLCVAAAVGLLACGNTGALPAAAPDTVHESRPSAAASERTAYVVRRGDSLSRIASCSGVSIADLAQSNGISNANVVLAGARLRLPQGHHCASPATREDGVAAPARAARLLATATARLDAADFERALSLAETCVHVLESRRLDTKANEIAARCHVVAGTAAAGLERRDRAIAEFREALVLDPHLELASDTTSPRIRELVSAARPDPSP